MHNLGQPDRMFWWLGVWVRACLPNQLPRKFEIPKKEAVFVLGTFQQRIGIRLIYMSTDLVRYCVQSQIQVVTSNVSGVWGDRKNVEVCRGR